MKPTAAEIENGMPRSHSASTPPVSASGTALKTSSASRTEPSARKSSRKIRRKQAGTTISEPLARRGQIFELAAPVDPVAGRQLHRLRDPRLRLGTTEPMSRPRTLA